MSAEKRLQELGLVLPAASVPAGNYASAVQTGNLLYLSGKAPSPVAGQVPQGKFGRDYSAQDGRALARSACLELIAAARALAVIGYRDYVCSSTIFEVAASARELLPPLVRYNF